MEFVLIEPETAEWNDMWERLAQHPINEGIEEPKVALHNGEAWQYMGSYKKADKVIHQFRHRQHPAYNNRQQITLYASDKFSQEQIAVSKKVK